MKSLLNTEKGTCYICGRYGQTHKHHIFGGPNRSHSEREGLYVYLCPMCHNIGRNSVHMNPGANRWLQKEGQMAFETVHTRKDFMDIFGKNYIAEE